MSTDKCDNYYKFWETKSEPRSKKVRSQPALKWNEDSEAIICFSYDDFLENFNIKGVLQCLKDGSLYRFMEMCARPNITNRIVNLDHSSFQTTQSVWNLIRILFEVDNPYNAKDKKGAKLDGFRNWLNISQSKDDFLKARISTCAYLTTFFDGIKFLYENKHYIHNPSLPTSDIDWKKLLDNHGYNIIRQDTRLSFYYGKILLSQGIIYESDDMLLATPSNRKIFDKLLHLYYYLGLGYMLVEEAAQKGLTEAQYMLKDIEKSNPNRVFWQNVNALGLQGIADGILSGRILPTIEASLNCSKEKELYIEQILDFIVELKCIVAIWKKFVQARNPRDTQQVFAEYIQKCESAPQKIDGLNNYIFNCAKIVRDLMQRYSEDIFPNMPFYRERKFVYGLVQQANQSPGYFDFSELAEKENYQLARWMRMCETHKEAILFRQSNFENRIDLIIKNLKKY